MVSDKLREKDLTLNLALLIRQEAQKAGNLQVQLVRARGQGHDDRGEDQGDQRSETGLRAQPSCQCRFREKSRPVMRSTFPVCGRTASGGGDSAAIIKDMANNRHLNDSVQLAQQIQAALETVFPRKGRGLRDAPSPLLDGLNIPGLVVEVGFATQPEDRKKLTDAETQKAIARALVKGLRDYFQNAP